MNDCEISLRGTQNQSKKTYITASSGHFLHDNGKAERSRCISFQTLIKLWWNIPYNLT